MSSTNVRSEEISNKYCASAQIIPTTQEKGLDIPPKNAKPGPTRDSISEQELVLEISGVGNYEVKEDGAVIDRGSKKTVGTVLTEEIKKNKEIRVQRAPSKYVKREDKGIEY